MKKRKNISSLLLFTFLIVGFLFFSSCKRKSLTPEPTPTSLTAFTYDFCNGNGTSSYWPLKVGNKWMYQDSATLNNYSDAVTGTIVIDGKEYFVINSNNYYRINSSGNIVKYVESFRGDFFMVPGNPILGEMYYDVWRGYDKVVSLNATITTPLCVYTGLLELAYFDKHNNYWGSKYFKKGLGLVTSTSAMGGSSPTYLKAVSLKK